MEFSRQAVLSLLVLASSTITEVSGGCTSIPYPKGMKDCYDQLKKYKKDVTGGVAAETCINIYLWKSADERWHQPYDKKTMEYLGNLYEKYMKPSHRKKRQTFPGPSGGTCIRKEIRQLTITEYDNYVKCLKSLKNDRSLSPNVYEAIANMHNGNISNSAHGGQAFLGWHTLYMLLFEFALRSCAGSPCLPYWDPTLDYNLPNPQNSILFKLLGGTDGQLESPFENWNFYTRGSPTPVIRRVSDTSDQLISNPELNYLLSSTNTHQMTRFPTIDARDIELAHNSLHGFLGGTVSFLETAAQDFIFFLLHGFIEYIFSENLKKMPEELRTVYPRGKYQPGHAPDEPMAGIGNLSIANFNETIQNKDAYKFGPGSLRSHFQYAPRPTCANNCQTPQNHLFCCQSIRQCVSKVKNPDKPQDNAGIIPQGIQAQCSSNNRKKRGTKLKRLPYVEPQRYIVQNDFILNGIPSKDAWVYIAVLIINSRPYGEHFSSYFFNHGKYDRSGDIYLASNCSVYSHGLKVGKAKPYKGCKASRSGSSVVYVRTDGINYNGHYKDYAIIDDRYLVSESVAYVAVKRPSTNLKTKVMITAHDECGRLCRPVCQSEGSSDSYKSCDGVLSIDNKPPLVYGKTPNDAMAKHWTFRKNKTNMPRFNKDSYCMNFICDSSVSFDKI